MVLATDRFVNKSSWTGISSRKYLHANSLSNGKSADKSTQGHYVNDHATMIHCVPPTSAKGTRCKIIKSRCKRGKGLCALSSSPFFRRNPHNRGHFLSLFKLLQTIFFFKRNQKKQGQHQMRRVFVLHLHSSLLLSFPFDSEGNQNPPNTWNSQH